STVDGCASRGAICRPHMGWKDLFWKSDENEEAPPRATPPAPPVPPARATPAPAPPARTTPAPAPAPAIAAPQTAQPEMISDAELAAILAGGDGGSAPTGTMMLEASAVEKITVQSGVLPSPAVQAAAMQVGGYPQAGAYAQAPGQVGGYPQAP